MIMLRKWYYAAPVFFGSAVAALAQEGSNPIDLSKAETAADNISDALSSLLTGKVLDALLVVLGALVVLWVVRKIPSWIGAGRA